MDDEDEWNPSKAASVCLMLLASCCEEDILPHVLPFVKENIENPDWRYRDAALMAFGKKSSIFVRNSVNVISGRVIFRIIVNLFQKLIN